jgi:hypothetical protein
MKERNGYWKNKEERRKSNNSKRRTGDKGKNEMKGKGECFI